MTMHAHIRHNELTWYKNGNMFFTGAPVEEVSILRPDMRVYKYEEEYALQHCIPSPSMADILRAVGVQWPTATCHMPVFIACSSFDAVRDVMLAFNTTHAASASDAQ